MVDEVYWSSWECPEDGCDFVFGFRNAVTEDEGREILNGIAKLHLRQRHPGIHVEVNIETVEPAAPGRPKLMH